MKKAKIDQAEKRSEGVLIFDHDLRPLYCNRSIETLCGRACKSGQCVLERSENQVPEFFKIVKKFREDQLA